MSDNLKKYTDHKREQFEVYDFDISQGWQQLSEVLGSPIERKKQNVWKWVAIAASVALVLSISFIMTQQRTDRYPSELSEVEQYYQLQIDQMTALVKTRAGSEQIVQDLERMDAAFEDLKADLSDDVHNEAVITAMIDNYRLKLKILEEILAELEEKEDESYPTI